MQWPPQSADLNPIEHLWHHLKIRLGEYDTPASGIAELWERVQKEWNDIPASVCQILSLTVNRCCVRWHRHFEDRSRPCPSSMSKQGFKERKADTYLSFLTQSFQKFAFKKNSSEMRIPPCSSSFLWQYSSTWTRNILYSMRFAGIVATCSLIGIDPKVMR